MRPKPQIVHDGPNQFRLAGQKNVSCPGYIPRSNKQGFTWKQVARAVRVRRLFSITRRNCVPPVSS